MPCRYGVTSSAAAAKAVITADAGADSAAPARLSAGADAGADAGEAGRAVVLRAPRRALR